MSLGIGIINSHGIALGADSLVTSSRNIIDQNVLAMIGMFTLSIKKEIEEGELSSDSYNAKAVNFLQSLKNMVEDIPANSFFSNKVFPMYRRNGKDYGGFISVGDAFLTRFNNDLIEIMDKEDRFKKLSFKKYIEALINLMFHTWKEQGFDDLEGEVLYLGYCVDAEEYLGYKVSINLKKDKEPELDVEALDGPDFQAIGDQDLVNKMILGFQLGLPRDIDIFMRVFLMRIIEDCFDGKNLEEHYISNVEDLAINAWHFGQENWDKIKCEISSDFYNPEEDKMRMDKYVDLAIKKVVSDIVMSLRSGASIDYITRVSLRECLQLITWLINSTSKFHSFIKEGIPTVGGDTYIATITAKEGFVFRTLDEYF